MKKITLMAATTLLVGIAFLVMSFGKNPSPAKPLSNVVTYSYIGEHKFIGAGMENSLVEAEVKAGISWMNVDAEYMNSSHLAAITWDRDLLSKQNAINGVWEYYEANFYSLPPDNFYITVSGVPVTIRRKADNN
jgi:hypothetical protein